MKKRLNTSLLSKLGKIGINVSEPVSLQHGGSTSLFTGQVRNILTWIYDDAPDNYLHKRFAMSVCLRGGCTVRVDNSEFILHPDEGIIIFPFQSHVLLSKAADMLNLAITFSLINSADRSLEPLKNRVFAVLNKDADILAEILETGGEGGAGKRGPETAPLLEWFLCRKLQEQKITHRAVLKDLDEDSKYFQIVGFIKTNIASPISVKDIANAVNLSVPHLRRIFKKHTGGLSVGRFIKGLRIKQSLEMLIHSDMNIAEISSRCGFSNQFVFSRAFKNAIGLSPLKYRMQYDVGGKHGEADVAAL